MSGAPEAAVRDLIYRAALLLDAERFKDWLALCAEDFTYRIQTYSPEIRKQMTWLQHDMPGLRTMIEMLPRHNTDHGQLSRHVSVYAIALEDGGKEASATSSFICHRTMLDGINAHLDAGETQLFLVGKYHDRFRLADGRPLFRDRTVFLDTRRLDKGSHYPI
ncbi:MAG TPA: nuclear transport factor 2 family protein [Stellaceae bacterium]|nr:nuclear transport factor 2 family protein [Stellaceae bacterium]